MQSGKTSCFRKKQNQKAYNHQECEQLLRNLRNKDPDARLLLDIDDTMLYSHRLVTTNTWFRIAIALGGFFGIRLSRILTFWESRYIGYRRAYPVSGATRLVNTANELKVPVHIITARRGHRDIRTHVDLTHAFPNLVIAEGPSPLADTHYYNGIYFTENKRVVLTTLHAYFGGQFLFVDDNAAHIKTAQNITNIHSVLFEPHP
jgi:hypothetical protein